NPTGEFEHYGYKIKPTVRMLHTDIPEVNLYGANLRRANLTGTDIPKRILLTQPKSIQSATLPNGQKYEDWIKTGGTWDGANTNGGHSKILEIDIKKEPKKEPRV
ncbi:MAG TPA: pentapeptide repeat-containing protein, partial [Anaerolineae bacterium]|nr:pentapeptide repeat-containing protein [Anaerolineae bacterium]